MSCIHAYTRNQSIIYIYIQRERERERERERDRKREMRTDIHTYIRTYVRTYILTYIHTYIHTYITTHDTFRVTDCRPAACIQLLFVSSSFSYPLLHVVFPLSYSKL